MILLFVHIGQITDSDIVIDWGDGSDVSVLKNTTQLPVVNHKNTEEVSKLSCSFYKELEQSYLHAVHTYKTDGIYEIKIFGKKYWAINHQYITNNKLCSAFTKNLKIASHIYNFSSFCRRK